MWTEGLEFLYVVTITPLVINHETYTPALLLPREMFIPVSATHRESRWLPRQLHHESLIRQLLSQPCTYIPRPPSRNSTGLCKLKTIHTEAAFIVAEEYNKANLRTRLPKFCQHIDGSTRAGKTLDHCYSNFGSPPCSGGVLRLASPAF